MCAACNVYCVCVCVRVCDWQCVLEDSCASAPALKPVCSSSMVPSVTLTSASHAVSETLSVPLTNGTQRHHNLSSANLLQAFDRLSVSTTNMTASASAGRRLSLGTLRVNSSQQRQATSSALFVDGSSILARPAETETSRRAVASGRSPRVRRKLGRPAGKGKDRRSAVKLSKVVIQSKLPVVDDWLKFDLSTVMAAGTADVGAGDDGSADEDGGSVAAAASFVDVTDAVSQRVENSELYAELAQLTKSVGRFTKLAYPDMYGHVVTPFKEAFYEKRFGTQR